MKILITGANGYIGSALLQDLQGNHEVIATARNIEQITTPGIQTHTLDILSPEQAAQVIASVKPDIVIHAAALPKRSTADDETFINTNVEGSRILAEATRQHSTAKFIFISSGCAFKQMPGTIITKNSPRELDNAFSLSKNLAEKAILEVFSAESSRVAIVYPPVILQKSQSKGIIPYALDEAKTSGTITNKVPNGHVNFITHAKFAELIEAIAKSETTNAQYYPITGSRFTTDAFFKILQALLRDHFLLPCQINTEASPHIETMCRMDETAIQQLKPDFDWENIGDVLENIISERTGMSGSRWMLNSNDPACQEITNRAQALGITGNPDSAAHNLGSITLANGKAVTAHVVHAVDPIITDGIEAVMINRRNDLGRGLPALPGGFIDPTKNNGVESAVQAAAREAMEEVGITLHSGMLIGTRNMCRPFDVRIAQRDMSQYGINKGDVFMVSTQAVRFDVPDLKATTLIAGDDALPGSARRVALATLSKDFMGVPDHFDMIQEALSTTPPLHTIIDGAASPTNTQISPTREFP